MEPLKNGLALPAITRLSNSIKACAPEFDHEGFIKAACHDINTFELKERVNHIIKTLHNFLPQPFSNTAKLFSAIVPVWQKGSEDDPLQSFAAWPFIDYVAAYGLNEPEIALPLLAEMTELFSAEFAIRPFIVEHPALTREYLDTWVMSDNEHIRRLVSEGTRPRLPWGLQLKAFIKSPEANIPLLEVLKDDTSLYVRRSVANHLNDISKDHPQLVLAQCKHWQQAALKQSEQESKNIIWLIKHALRTLIKSGRPEVFPLLGYTETPQILCTDIDLSSQTITMGESINFNFSISSQSNNKQKLVVDFAIHYVKNNGKTNAKVFKLKNITLATHETFTFSKRHPFKSISTRKHYEGTHSIDILVNGIVMQSASFNLLK